MAETSYFCDARLESSRQIDGPDYATCHYMEDNEIDGLTERVIGAAIAVHTALGPGLLESVYRDCLAIELRHLNIPFQLEVRFPIVYRGTPVRDRLRVDLVVDGRLVVEIKVVERLRFVFKAQVITYLKISNCPAGLILNFNAPSLREGLQRVDRPDLYARKLMAKRAGARLPRERAGYRIDTRPVDVGSPSTNEWRTVTAKETKDGERTSRGFSRVRRTPSKSFDAFE